MGEQFIKRPFSFYDSGVIPVLGPMIFTVYEMLRRFTWRSAQVGHEEVRDLVKGGLVVARISQTTLGDKLGLSRPKLNGYVQRMHKLGWINLIELEKGGSLVYQLGEKLRDSQDCEHEVFFADAWLQRLWHMLDEEACRLYGPVPWDERDSTAGDAVSEAQRSKMSIQRLTDAERLQAIRKAVPPEVLTRQPKRREKGKKEAKTDAWRYKGDRVSIKKGTASISKGLPLNREGGEEENDIEERERAGASPPGTPAHSEKGFERGAASRPTPPPPQPPPRSTPPETSCLSGQSKGTPPTCAGVQRSAPSASRGSHGRTAPRSAATRQALEERQRELAAPGKAMTQADLAELESQTAEATRERQRRAAQQVERSRATKQQLANLEGKKALPGERKLLKKLEKLWQEGMSERWPDIDFGVWGPKQRGQCRTLLKTHSPEVVELTLRYVLESWEDIQRDILKTEGGLPSLGMVVKLIDVLGPRAQKQGKTAGVRAEYRQWFADNPNVPPPEDLERRYRQVMGQR